MVNNSIEDYALLQDSAIPDLGVVAILESNAAIPTKNSNQPSFGVLVVNLGTPDAPTKSAVARYLKEFLSDIRVVDQPRWLWWLILNGIILRFRPRKVAKLYASVWDSGSPLANYTEALAKKMESLLDGIPVEYAMTYGNPSIQSASKRFRALGIKRLVVLPLYPQFSATTTAAAFDALAKQLKPCPDVPEITFIRDYHLDAGYINALAQSVNASIAKTGPSDLLLMSFHGIPQRYHRQGDPYPLECEATANALAEALNLQPEQWKLTYQSRFGREPWLMPYTDKTLESLPKEGIKNIHIICPGFAVDCLETLEEIQVENKEVFEGAGGEGYHYIPCLNDDQAHAEALAALIRKKMPTF